MTKTRKAQLKRTGVAGLLAASALTLSMAGFAPAVAGQEFVDAWTNGKVILDTRYRYEHVEQTLKPEDAAASTFRVRLGYETAEFWDMKLLVEFENISNIGDEDYNNTVNGKGAMYPTVADPDITELNRAQVTFTGLPETAVILGRQRINLGDQRFVGAVGFRQNEQTYDALVVQNKSIPKTTLTGAYVHKVHRVFGDDNPAGNLDTEAFAFNLDYNCSDALKLTGFGYLLDIEQAPGLSTSTFGVRATGKYSVHNATWGYDTSWARQSDYANNLASIELDYYNVAGSVAFSGFKAGLGYEVLEGDGSVGFTTPLATLHKFQGFADKFLGTPATGIEDFNANVSYTFKDVGVLKSLKFAAWYHDFSANVGGANHGDELDLLVAAKLPHGVGVSVKYADYNADTWATDTQKLWFTVSYKY